MILILDTGAWNVPVCLVLEVSVKSGRKAKRHFVIQLDFARQCQLRKLVQMIDLGRLIRNRPTDSRSAL